ncbi:MAG TPA: glycosyltransferase [Patescibacteria group bacterium]
MKEFTVVMPCWIINEELLELTKNAVESFGEVNLIVVDNGSTVGGGYLRSVADTYIRNKENLGYARAVNQGLMLGELGKYTAISNNDIRVSSNWQEVAREVLLNDKAYSCHFRMIPYDEAFNHGDMTALTGKERWCSSSFFVLSPAHRKFLYDEAYGLGGYEDYDYWYRVRTEGLYTAYTNKASYQHKDSSTQNLLNQEERAKEDQRRREYFKSKFGEYPDILFAKTYPEQMKERWKPMP